MNTLLELGADVNARTLGGATPLHIAVKNSNPEIVKLLLTGGADTSVDYKGRTTFAYAEKVASDEGTSLARQVLEAIQAHQQGQVP